MKPILFSFTLFGLLSVAEAQNYSLLKDIQTEPTDLGSYPGNYCILDGDLYFFAEGTERRTYYLMKSDLAAAGTVPVKMLSQSSYQNASTPVVLGSKMIFTVYESGLGDELWVSNGTEAGTKMLKDIWTGSGGSNPAYFTLMNGKVYFAAADHDHGYELWVTDGTLSGTHIVKDINPGPESSYVGGITAMGGYIYFSAYTDATGNEMYRSDGSASGTEMIVDFNPGPGDGMYTDIMEAMNGYIYFNGNEGGLNCLARTDGTAAGTENVSIMTLDGTNILEMVAMPDNKLYMNCYTPGYGAEPWVSDGTGAGTELLGDFVTGQGDGAPGYFTWYNNKVYFACSKTGSGAELFSSDGTPAGTDIHTEILPGNDSGTPVNFTVSDNILFFQAMSTNMGGGRELWKLEGNNAPVRVKDMDPGTPNETLDPMFDFDGQLVFKGRTGATGYELYTSDGTENGTQLVKDIVTLSTSYSPRRLAVNGNTLFFQASVNDDMELWSSDGTMAGTSLLKNIHPTLDGYPDQITPLGNKTIFTATDNVNGTELWITDGTAPGTQLLKDIVPGAQSSGITDIVPVSSGTAYFIASSHLWQTDGTAPNTIEITTQPTSELIAGAPGSGYVFFVMDDATTGREIYYLTNGFIIPTTDIIPGSEGSNPYDLTLHGNDSLIFSATGTAAGMEPYILDIASGTSVLLKDINPGEDPSEPYGFTYNNGLTYFSAYSPGAGYELWVTDGTESGTVMLKDIYPGPGDGGPNFLTPLGDYIVFSAADANGDELWITDGTEAGTHPIIDLAPGAESSVPQNLMVHGDEIIFTAYKPGTGIELWQTDGTANGTILLADINPDGNSHPLEFVTMGDILYFTAYHPNSGREIWALNMETLSVTPLGSAELSVYPNPTVESLTIDLSELKDEKTNVQVWSLNGQKIIERQFNGNNLLTLNVSGLAPSAYLLRVENGNKVFSQAFIKQ